MRETTDRKNNLRKKHVGNFVTTKWPRGDQEPWLLAVKKLTRSKSNFVLYITLYKSMDKFREGVPPQLDYTGRLHGEAAREGGTRFRPMVRKRVGTSDFTRRRENYYLRARLSECPTDALNS